MLIRGLGDFRALSLEFKCAEGKAMIVSVLLTKTGLHGRVEGSSLLRDGEFPSSHSALRGQKQVSPFSSQSACVSTHCIWEVSKASPFPPSSLLHTPLHPAFSRLSLLGDFAMVVRTKWHRLGSPHHGGSSLPDSGGSESVGDVLAAPSLLKPVTAAWALFQSLSLRSYFLISGSYQDISHI